MAAIARAGRLERGVRRKHLMSTPQPTATQADHPTGAPAASDPSSTNGTVEVTAGDEESIPAETLRRPQQTKHWYRVALVLTLILIVGVVIALPLAIRSMYGTLFTPTNSPYYDLETGQVLTTAEIEATELDRTYMNIAVADVAEDTGTASMTVSGHRTCTGTCPELDLLLLSLDQSATRRGLAPSAELQVLEAVDVFTENVELPITGNPSLYPFDSYTIQLAVAGFSRDSAGHADAADPGEFWRQPDGRRPEPDRGPADGRPDHDCAAQSRR